MLADERTASGSGIQVRVTITEGNELVAQLDVLHLTPNSQITRVYEVPGTKLTIFADAAGGTSSDGVDVLVYGTRTDLSTWSLIENGWGLATV